MWHSCAFKWPEALSECFCSCGLGPVEVKPDQGPSDFCKQKARFGRNVLAEACLSNVMQCWLNFLNSFDAFCRSTEWQKDFIWCHLEFSKVSTTETTSAWVLRWFELASVRFVVCRARSWTGPKLCSETLMLYFSTAGPVLVTICNLKSRNSEEIWNSQLSAVQTWTSVQRMVFETIWKWLSMFEH